MTSETARLILEADSDRTGFRFATLLRDAGPARRGWWRTFSDARHNEFCGATWSEAVRRAKACLAPVDSRDAEIASAVASGAAVSEVAEVHGLSPARAGQIARAAGVETRPGRRPTGAATHHTARGRALLARLVEIAAARGVEPEALLDGLVAPGA